MEVKLSSGLEARLVTLAEQEGRDTSLLVVEAVQRLVDYDEWFLSEVEKGISQIESGNTLSHEEVVADVAKYLAGKQLRA